MMRKSKWRLLLSTFILMYYIFCGPVLLLYVLFIDSLIYKVGSFFLIFLPIFLIYKSAKSKKNKIHDIVNALKSSKQFEPEKQFEFYNFWSSKYLGIDLKKGTVLYVCIWPTNVIDILGFDVHNIVNTESQGSTLRIYTGKVSLPMISYTSVTGANPAEIQDRIMAMCMNNYSYSVNFPNLVDKKRKEFESISGMPVIEVY